MSAMPTTVDELLRELHEQEDVSFHTISGEGLFFTYLWKKPGATRFYFSGPATTPGSWFRFESEEWQLWGDFDAIRRVRFVREPEHDDPERDTLSIRLIGANDRPWLGFSFEHLYDEQKRPVPVRFALWEALRAKYGGCDELRVENGRLVCPT